MKNITFHCESCGCVYELDPECCILFTINRTSFLRKKIETYAASVCSKCLYKNIEQIRSDKSEDKPKRKNS